MFDNISMKNNSEIIDSGDSGQNVPKNPVFNGDFNPILGRKSDLVSSKASIESAHVQKGEVVDALVCLPNSTLRLSQSEKKKKSLTSGKKRKSVKELKEELELKSIQPITCFFKKKQEMTEHIEISGESKSIN